MRILTIIRDGVEMSIITADSVGYDGIEYQLHIDGELLFACSSYELIRDLIIQEDV